MMSTGGFARAKGQRGERDAIKTLQPIVDKVYLEMGYAGENLPVLERNQMQSARGGHDIIGLDWLALEIKHQETLSINTWWSQAQRQAKGNQIPVLMYRQNRIKWRVVMNGYIPAGEKRIKCPVDITLEAFLLWLEYQLKAELTK